jgi:hypothetical protein
MGEPVRKLTDGELREAQGTPGLARRTALVGDGGCLLAPATARSLIRLVSVGEAGIGRAAGPTDSGL